MNGLNPTLNAVVSLDHTRARTQAKAADDALDRGETWGPLHGVPMIRSYRQPVEPTSDGRSHRAAVGRYSPCRRKGSDVATYVLVHGAWSGAHGFHLVRPLLRAEGHEVFTPSLTGIGERAHLVSPQVDLTTHITDVVNHVLYEDLDDVVLLGFSYGGMVVTGALEHIAPRVSHLVYLDAFVPGDGDTLFGLLGHTDVAPPGLGDPWLVPPSPRDFDDPAETAFANPRRVPHPIACFIEPVRLRQPLEDFSFTRTYIRATADGPDAPGGAAFESAAARARNSPAWQYHEIATNHMIPNNRPKELADLLLKLA